MMIAIFLIGKDFKPHKKKKNNKFYTQCQQGKYDSIEIQCKTNIIIIVNYT
jgi:hypothetical protein